MIIRNFTDEDFSYFLDLYENNRFREFIESMNSKNNVRPEWCFIAEENGTVVGKLLYFIFDGNDKEMNLLGLELPWEEDYLETGEKLIYQSIDIIKQNKISKIEFRCDSTDKYNKEMIMLLEKAGFNLIQSKYRFTLTELCNKENSNNNFTFKNLHEIGNEQFINAIEKVSEGTLDRVDFEDIKRLGKKEAAISYFNILKSINYSPDKWFLAYKDNILVGLIVPQVLSKETGCINYIGIVPEHRGKNYSKDLLIKASKMLLELSDIEKVIADIDANNFPLEKSLSSINYKKTMEEWVYQKYF